jgi:hypothetical protein
MNKDNIVTAVTLNDIIQQRLAGIENKIDIAGVSNDDSQLKQGIQMILDGQREIATILKSTKGSS